MRSCSGVSMNIVIRLGVTTGPVCVCDEFNTRLDRSMPYSFRILAAAKSATERGSPIRSVVIKTTRTPLESSSASALANNGWATPSDGFVRFAYPDNQMGPSGVMLTLATPARNPPAAATSGNSKKIVETLRFISNPGLFEWNILCAKFARSGVLGVVRVEVRKVKERKGTEIGSLGRGLNKHYS